jgi:uncharacterized membrane protein YgaE (UPF0421/DUF939 family)
VVVRLLEAVAKENKIFTRAFNYFKKAYAMYVKKPEKDAVRKFLPALNNLYKHRAELGQYAGDLRDLFREINARNDILTTNNKAKMDKWLSTM